MKRIVVGAGLVRGAPQSPEEGRFLLSRRPNGTHLARWWEFPGGKVEPGENPAESVRRELKEELDIMVSVGDIYAVGHHVYDEREVILLVYEAVHTGGLPTCLGVSEFAWLTAEEIVALELPPADEPVVERLRREYM